MVSAVRPRRSALYIPGNNVRALEKAKALHADVLILDLEDAVGHDAKAESRGRVCEAVASGAYRPRELVIRINGMDTEWHADDLRAVARSGADGVLVPKVQSAQQVKTLAETLDALHAPDSLQLWVMIETPAAFLMAHEIATASERLAVLVVGSNDLVNDLRGLHVPGRAPILPALSLAVLAARAGGKTILDSVFNAIADDEGFMAEARQGRQMGYDGKTLIHPSQIGPANDAFGASAEELADARRIIMAYNEAQAAGDSVIVVDGRMVESLHVRNAERILALGTVISEFSSAS